MVAEEFDVAGRPRDDGTRDTELDIAEPVCRVGDGGEPRILPVHVNPEGERIFEHD